MKFYYSSLLVLFCIFLSASAVAKDRIELDEASIQGASELPKVLYIVPWKKGIIDNKPVKMGTMIDEVMAPVDRAVLLRQIRFHEAEQAAAQSENADK